MGGLVPTAQPARLPGPPELRPERPDATIDLQSADGVALVDGQWRFHDAAVSEVEFVAVGRPDDPLGPGLTPNRTFDVVPHAEVRDLDDSGWRALSADETRLRLSGGRVCFAWYRIRLTLPERVGGLDVDGAAVVLEIVVDDYAEVWVDGRLPRALGDAGGPVVGGFNAPNRVLLTDSAAPGDVFQVAVLGINGPISASPANYIWIRNASLDLYASGAGRSVEPVAMHRRHVAADLDAVLSGNAQLERVATGFAFTEGPVWSPEGALLFSSPNTNCIYRWHPSGRVTVFRPKSGYRGGDIGRFVQPGSNGLTFDAEGRLTICQHGDRRVIRVEPHGDTTVLAERFEGRRLNSPNDLVYRSDGALFFTDPPFGLPGQFDDPDRELDVSGVFVARDGGLELVTAELRGPNGLAFSPDEHVLYVGNWDPRRSLVMRYELDERGHMIDAGVLLEMPDPAGSDGVDGLKVDRAGTVFACGPGGIWVVSADGDHLGTLSLPEAAHNLAWGDADRRTLYVTAETSIYRIRTRVGGRAAAAPAP